MNSLFRVFGGLLFLNLLLSLLKEVEVEDKIFF